MTIIKYKKDGFWHVTECPHDETGDASSTMGNVGSRFCLECDFHLSKNEEKQHVLCSKWYLEIQEHYAGRASDKFWELVNKHSNEKNKLYEKGCQLQNLEDEILEELERNESLEQKKTITKTKLFEEIKTMTLNLNGGGG